jgi:hypothetical protein
MVRTPAQISDDQIAVGVGLEELIVIMTPNDDGNASQSRSAFATTS